MSPASQRAWRPSIESVTVCVTVPPPRPQLGLGGLLAGAGLVAPYRLHLPSGAAVRTVAAGRYPHTGQGGHPAVPPAGAQAEDIAARHWCGE